MARAQAEVARDEFMLRKRFAETFADYEAARNSAETLQVESLPKAEEVYRLYRDSFQQPRAAWPQVLDTQREYFELVEEIIGDLLGARRAEARIAALLLEDGLEQPAEPTPAGHRDAVAKPR